MKKKFICMGFLMMFYTTSLWANIDTSHWFDYHMKELQSYKSYQNSGNGIVYDTEKVIRLEDVIKEALNHNLSVALSLYEIKMSDSNYIANKANYSPYMLMGTSYSSSKYPPGGMAAFTGDKVRDFDWDISVAKKYRSGTELAIGLVDNVNDANDSSGEPILHNSQLYFSLQQQLLKNAFGINDILLEKILKKQAESSNAVAKYQVSQIVAGVIADYWNASVAYRNLCDTEIELNVYKVIRKKLKENVELGLLEPYYLNQFNALIYVSEIKLEQNRYLYFDSLKNIKTIMNLRDSHVTITPLMFSGEIKDYDLSHLKMLALENRADYLMAINNVEITKMSLDLYKNESLPDLKAGYTYAGLGKDKMPGNAFGDATGGNYSSSEVSLTMTYLFDDKNTEINIRNAKYQYEQALLQKKKIENEIDYQIDDAVRRVSLASNSLKKVKLAGKEIDIYITSLISRLSQGKVNTSVMQNAVDMLVQYRTTQTQTLNAFNLAMLNVEMVTNSLLTEYGIDLDESIKLQTTTGGSK